MFKCSEFVGNFVTVVRQVFRFSGKSVARVFCPFRLTGKFVARVFGVFRFAGKIVARVLEVFRKFGSTAIILCLKQVASGCASSLVGLPKIRKNIAELVKYQRKVLIVFKDFLWMGCFS
ncbi:hypothetical protein [Kaistella carnis]|uniref:Uncharacterized protein n=1 Tax=Kaistella carnis TaxID=1241979 RepID=A0A3G8XUE4_9FLAO|nr:hypothetical protein [Kaistella carnis]AZI33834.1 hypothetical protein EIB73_11850 [Kaistella carnis]